jgi:hypothetical protein
MITPQQIGGRIMAERQHNESVQRYLQHPNICPQCNNPILPQGKSDIQHTKRKKFCSSSCSATYNNTRKPKKPPKPVSYCITCRQPLKFPGKTGMCRQCVLNKQTLLPINITKNMLKHRRKNYQSYRNAIRRHAQRIFEQSQKPKICAICGYTLHVEIAHRKPVSDFPTSATLGEINNIDNLIPFCPTHHWEWDNGILKL